MTTNSRTGPVRVPDPKPELVRSTKPSSKGLSNPFSKKFPRSMDVRYQKVPPPPPPPAPPPLQVDANGLLPVSHLLLPSPPPPPPLPAVVGVAAQSQTTSSVSSSYTPGPAVSKPSSWGSSSVYYPDAPAPHSPHPVALVGDGDAKSGDDSDTDPLSSKSIDPAEMRATYAELVFAGKPRNMDKEGWRKIVAVARSLGVDVKSLQDARSKKPKGKLSRKERSQLLDRATAPKRLTPSAPPEPAEAPLVDSITARDCLDAALRRAAAAEAKAARSAPSAPPAPDGDPPPAPMPAPVPAPAVVPPAPAAPAGPQPYFGPLHHDHPADILGTLFPLCDGQLSREFTEQKFKVSVVFDPTGLRAQAMSAGATIIYDVRAIVDPVCVPIDGNWVRVKPAALPSAHNGHYQPLTKPQGFELVGDTMLASEVLQAITAELQRSLKRKEETEATLMDAALTSAHNHLDHLKLKNREMAGIDPYPLLQHPYYAGMAVERHATEGVRRAWRRSAETQRNVIPDMNAARVALPAFGVSRKTFFLESDWLSKQLKNNTNINAFVLVLVCCLAALCFIASVWVLAMLPVGLMALGWVVWHVWLNYSDEVVSKPLGQPLRNSITPRMVQPIVYLVLAVAVTVAVSMMVARFTNGEKHVRLFAVEQPAEDKWSGYYIAPLILVPLFLLGGILSVRVARVGTPSNLDRLDDSLRDHHSILTAETDFQQAPCQFNSPQLIIEGRSRRRLQTHRPQPRPPAPRIHGVDQGQQSLWTPDSPV